MLIPSLFGSNRPHSTKTERIGEKFEGKVREKVRETAREKGRKKGREHLLTHLLHLLAQLDALMVQHRTVAHRHTHFLRGLEPSRGRGGTRG